MTIRHRTDHPGERANVESKSPESIVRKWWTLIDQRNFEGATRLCWAKAVVDWPLSNERMAAIEDWKSVNEHYPGRWNASITELIDQDESVVTVTRVFNDDTSVTAISFFTIRDGLIEKIVEYWPETYDPPDGRSQWIVPIS